LYSSLYAAKAGAETEQKTVTATSTAIIFFIPSTSSLFELDLFFPAAQVPLRYALPV